MDKKPEQTEEIKQPETLAEVVPTSETVATSLFPELETEKPKEEVMDLSPRPFNGLLDTTVTARWCWMLHAISVT